MDKRKIKISYLLIVLFFYFKTQFSAQIYVLDLDSLWNVVKSEKSADTSKVNALSKIASQYFNTFPDSTIYFLNQSIDLSKSLGYKKGIAKGYMNLGAISSIRGDLNLAAEYTIKALEIIEQTEHKNYNIQILANIAVLMQEIGEIEKAIEYAVSANELAIQIKDIPSQINTSNALATFKGKRGNYKDAANDYKKSIELAEKYNVYNSDYFYVLMGMAECYDQLYNVYDSAIVWYNKADTIRIDLRSYNLDIDYFLATSNHSLQYKKLELSESLADSLLYYSKKIKARANIAKYYFLKAEIRKEKGLYKTAFEYFTKAVKHKDSIQKENREEKLLALEMKYNSEKKGKELLLKKAELEKNNLEIKNQRNQKIIMMIVFGLGTIFTWYVIFSFYKNRKKNILLKAKNEELEKLSIVVKEIDSAVIITDKKGIIEWVNEGVLKMYGITNNKIGKNISKTSNYVNIKSVIKECVNTKKSSFYTSKHTKQDGTEIWAQTTLTPILDNENNISKLVFIDTNVSDVKKSEVQLSKQKALLESKNNKITDSFNYAKRIQQAVLPSKTTMSKIWKEYFVFLKPKDIVSGDFYWVYEKNNKKYLAIVDCTGHGVPGAFMTIIGNNLLYEILQDNYNTPVEILQELHIRIKIRLGGSINAKVIDSMDIGLVCLNTSTYQMSFAGTHTSVYLIRGRTLVEYKGSKETIGFKNSFSIKMHTFTVKPNDMIYMHTDGYPDQKGGHKNKKFYYQPIRDMFVNIGSKSVKEQKDIVVKTLEQWKGDRIQTDDVCLCGVRILPKS